MKKVIIFICLSVFSMRMHAQEQQPRTEGNRSFDDRSFSSSKNKSKGTEKKERPPVSEYLIIDIHNDTTHVDTSLTIQKHHNFNYLRRDDFGLLPINNVGQSYNSLIKVEERDHVLPLFGARARHFNFMEVEDIQYYRVPTPLSELYFNTTFEQGQQLDAFITVNTSPQLNLAIAYKGVRSLGKYQHALTSTGNFRAIASYHTKNRRYKMRTHFVAQDLLNEENGGLSDDGIDQYLGIGAFVDEAEDFEDRSAISVNFENAESTLLGKRFYLEHQYELLKPIDSMVTRMAIGHRTDLTDKSYTYEQTEPSEFIGEAYVTGAINDRVALEDFTNHLFLNFRHKRIGALELSVGNSNYNYGYNTLLNRRSGNDANSEIIRIPNRIKGEVFTTAGRYKNTYKGFEIFADGEIIVSGDFDGYHFTGGTGYLWKEKYGVKVALSANEVAPNYNFLLFQNDYINYNWRNDFTTVKTQKLQVDLLAKQLADVSIQYSAIDDYAYFARETTNGTIQPFQTSETINLFQVKLSQGIQFWKVGLDNTVMYQNVEGGDQVYNVPEFITRNSLYYRDRWFKKALLFETGVVFKYFSAYRADGYDPILAEFYTQNSETIGGFPQFDIFVNLKIRQTRVFFKVENFGEAFKQNTQFSAPRYAPRDAVLRFGLVWNFFM